MECHALGQSKWYMQCLIPRLRKELQHSSIPPAQPIYIISPVDKEAAPYHHSKNREIEPMRPTYSQRMLLYNAILWQGDDDCIITKGQTILRIVCPFGLNGLKLVMPKHPDQKPEPYDLSINPGTQSD